MDTSPFSTGDFRARMTRAVRDAAAEGLDGLLVTPGPDLWWLTGYRPTAITERLTLLVLRPDEPPRLLVPQLERPDAEAAKDVFSKYLTTTLPLHSDDLTEFGQDRTACIQAMIQGTVERMYAESEENRFLEVTYANGDKEVLYFRDFNSGAMIQNIVDRAKKKAIKSVLETGQPGLRMTHLLDSIVDEFAENEDLPNTTNPDDWARISGKKGERIVYIRTLVTGKSSSANRAIDTESNLGQYL